MKSNAQLQRDDSEVPPPAAMPVGFPDMALSSHTILPSETEVNYAQIMEALAALQGGMSSMQVSMSSTQQSMCSMQQSISSMQLAVHSIDRRVEQNQLDLHYEDDADRILPMPEDV
jgi:hypothetical protein